ncbi:hypothetical protein FGIG_03824 [Fasciola gigantica]|uniref:Uncharacterized protein n=1 Tax=Fasciola gigantica TaxID=46835 RepID=A0A504YAF5_FASGI|nr:hypothetical protein FGIG_03824 [Fasciola gigantica]
MLNLSLHGSSMNLNKCGVSSARTAKTSSRDTKTWNERTIDPQKSHKSSSGNKTVELHQPDSDVHLSLDDSDEDCPVLQRATVPAGDDRLSPTDLARSKRNVSEWLTTCVNDELVNWEKIDMISVASTFTDSQRKVKGRRKIKHDPELRILLDSLDATPDLEKDIKIQNSGHSSQRTLAGQEHEIVEASDTNDEPPPCQARPQSNSLISVRTKDGTGTETIICANYHFQSYQFQYLNSFFRDSFPLLLISAESVTNEQGFLMHDQAARIIQGFWRRHRRRKLAAQAALRRMMAEQKRRLDDAVRSQGMPLRAAQARQKQMNERRVLEDHRKRIRALRAKSTNMNLPETESAAINEMQLVKDSRPTHGPKEILSKPASPMITPRQARYSGASNRSITLRKDPTIDQENSNATPNHGTNCDETDHDLVECTEDQFEIQSHGRSTMDEIIQDLGRLGSVDEVDPDDLNIKHSEANRIITPLTDIQAESNSKGWSEMFHEIHRVLSEPDEADQYSYKTNERSSSRRSETPRVKEISHTPGILRPMTVDLGIHKMRKTASVSDPPSLLTKRNVQEHNR